MAARRPARLPRKVAEFVQWERVCGRLYFGSGDDGRKMRNIAENPNVTVVVDAYSDAWGTLRGVMIQGRAALIARGPRFRRARDLLYRKYPQYPRDAALSPSDSVIVEVTPRRVFAWGFD